MPKQSTHSVQIVVTDPETGLQVKGWRKQCPYCRKEYETTSKTQKYCCSECAKKDAKRKKEAKKAYDATKEYARIKSRAHSLGVETLRLLGRLDVCECCGTTEGPFEVHHKDLRWLNNNPDNLQVLCQKCHHAAHSAIDQQWKSTDITHESYYSLEEWPIYEPTIK